MPVTAQEIDRALLLGSPWWTDSGWAAHDSQLRQERAAPFDYKPSVLRSLTDGALYLLRGPRRVGKSTLMKRKIEQLLAEGVPARSIVHCAVEGWTSKDLEQLIIHAADQLTGEPGRGYWFLDEVSGVTGPWPSVLKRQRDLNPRFGEDTVVVTGSSAAQLNEATKELAGRRGRATGTDRLLMQMPFVEVARALGVPVPEVDVRSPVALSDDDIADLVRHLAPWTSVLADAWATYLTIGGYPQAVADHLEAGSVGDDLRQTLFDVVHGDALLRSGLAPVQTAGLLRGVTRSLTSILSTDAAATDAGIAGGTARERLEDLRLSFLAYPVHREQGLGPKPRARTKWYFTDPLLAQLAAFRGAGSGPDPTQLAEQQLSLVLLRALERISPGAALSHDQLFYYRSSTGAEIDFVAAAFDGMCFESKYSDRNWGRVFQTIAASPYRAGIVASRTGTDRHDAGRVLPASLLAVILGG